MTRKTRKQRKVWNDTNSVWGKNPELEKFWSGLASGKHVIVIYNDGTKASINLPKKFTEKYNTVFNEFDEDPRILAVLTSTPSQDAYEQYLYPKAKDKSIDYVIKHYKKYFKSLGPPPKDILASGAPAMKKVRVPL